MPTTAAYELSRKTNEFAAKNKLVLQMGLREKQRSQNIMWMLNRLLMFACGIENPIFEKGFRFSDQ